MTTDYIPKWRKSRLLPGILGAIVIFLYIVALVSNAMVKRVNISLVDSTSRLTDSRQSSVDDLIAFAQNHTRQAAGILIITSVPQIIARFDCEGTHCELKELVATTRIIPRISVPFLDSSFVETSYVFDVFGDRLVAKTVWSGEILVPQERNWGDIHVGLDNAMNIAFAEAGAEFMEQQSQYELVMEWAYYLDWRARFLTADADRLLLSFEIDDGNGTVTTR